MGNHFRLQVKFWGVRGSFATPTPENMGYGGNTTCIEVRSPGGMLVIDAGTGLRNLGLALQHESGGAPCSILVLLTHFHWDHIQGIPFFTPLFSPANEVTFRAHGPAEQIADALRGQMSSPYFPFPFDMLPARRHLVANSSQPFQHGGMDIHPFPLNHPQRATGYRIEGDGAVIVHAADFEHGDAEMDRILREYAQNADILIMDTQYTPEEYESKRGWGHSTWLEATRIARDAGVKQLILFHHDPTHNDEAVDRILVCARQQFENTVAAREGGLACV